MEQVTAGARVAVAGLIALGLLMGWVRDRPGAWPAWAALVTFIAVDAVFRQRHAERLPRISSGSALADLVLYGAVVMATGGPHSPLGWLLAFGLIWQAHRLEPRASLPISAAYVALFVVIDGDAPHILLRAAAMGVLGVFLGVGSARRAELHRRNLRDGLTGCFSREYGNFALRRLVADNDYPFSLLFLDLDYFKRVNDTLGHDFGDRVLAHAGRAIRGAVRTGDIVVRYGGDEFLVLLSGADIDTATELGERVRERLGQAAEALLGPCGDLSVTASCGVVEASPGQRTDELLGEVDRRLYQAKQRRDCTVGGMIGA